MKYTKLREKYPEFIYKSYEYKLEGADLHTSFIYSTEYVVKLWIGNDRIR